MDTKTLQDLVDAHRGDADVGLDRKILVMLDQGETLFRIVDARLGPDNTLLLELDPKPINKPTADG